ncbi:MAG: hypothetical protein RLZZ388_692 [Bacillota bacterium]
MKLTEKQSKILIAASVVGVGVIGLTVALLSQPSNSRLTKPVDINWDTYQLTNVTELDSSNEMEYYSGTVHLDDCSYVIGGIDQNDNTLPLIRQLDDTGAVVEDYFFGLDEITIDAGSFSGHVVQLREWAAQDTMLLLVNVSPRYLQNGEVKRLSGPLGDLLDSEAAYGLYLRLVLTWNPRNYDLALLYVAGERTDANPFYDLYDVIPEEDTLLLGFNYDANQHTLDFAFDNPRHDGEGDDYILQRFQYNKHDSSITPIENENWILASDFNENTNVNVGKDLYREAVLVDGLLSLSIRGNLNNGVEIDQYITWKNDFDITGLNLNLLRDIKIMFDDQFADLPEEESYFYPVFDVALLIDTTNFENVGYVLEVENPYAGKMYQGGLYQSGDAIYFLYSVRFYGYNPITDSNIDAYKTNLYSVLDGQLTLMESFTEAFGFYAFGLLFTKNAVIFYGYQIWGLTELEYPDGEVKLLWYDLDDGDTDDYVINSSGHDYAFDVRVNLTDNTIDFYAYVANADEDYATLENETGNYMTVKISFPIEGE